MPNPRKEMRHVNSFLSAFFKEKKEYLSEDNLGRAKIEPDFIFEFEGKVIGIEHTEMFLDVDSRGVIPKAHAKNAEDIVGKARLLFEKSSNIPLHVYVRFRNDYGLKRGEQPISLTGKNYPKNLSQIIAECVLSNVPSFPGQLEIPNFCERRMGNRFPEVIDEISITRFTPNITQAVWSSSRGGAVPSVLPKVTKRLGAKNKRPANYTTAFDEIWVLMVENRAKYESGFDFKNFDPADNKIDSPFNRVFVYRYADRVIIELVNTRNDQDRWPCVK